MNTILWKSLQETLERVDKLEAKIQELEKPKAKAKAISPQGPQQQRARKGQCNKPTKAIALRG